MAGLRINGCWTFYGWTWRVKVSLHIELELMGRLWALAEEEGIRVFAENLRNLLLAAPALAHAQPSP